MANPSRFLRVWIVSVAAVAVLVVGINLLVDPYDVFGTPRIEGISILKPAAKNHAMLAKTYQVARANPVTVLIGSSSTHLGLDANARQWPMSMRPVYNYGVPGESATWASFRTLEEAIAGGSVKNALLFVDFQNFLVPEVRGVGTSEDDRRYHLMADGNVNPDRLMQLAKDMFLSSATMGALLDSITTIIGQSKTNTLNLTPTGSSNAADFIEAARLDGMHTLFAQKDGYELERVTKMDQAISAWRGPLPNLDIVANIITLAHAHNVKLTVAITPRHVDAMEIYWRFGLWPRVEQFKTELAEMTTKEGVTLWDFMDYSTFTTESVPPAGDKRRPTSWFWESTHYKKQLGEVMIESMFGPSQPIFGVMLTPANVRVRDAHVRAQRQSVVCEGASDPPLSVLTRPMDDGCATPRSVVAHGSTSIRAP